MEQTTPEKIEPEESKNVLSDARSNFITILKVKLSRKKVKVILFFLAAILGWIVILECMTAQKYDATVKVAQGNEESAVNPNASELDYGVVAKGSSALRFITVENQGTHDAYVMIIKIGDIGEVMKIEPSKFSLIAGKYEEIVLSVDVPADADETEYEGSVVVFRIPKIF